MKFSKLKKVLSSVTAAFLCAVMIFGVSVSAAENKDVWKEAKAMTGASYSSKYIKWVEKYSEKEPSKTIAYSKSKTKKFFDKYNAAREENTPLGCSFINKDEIISAAYSGNNNKVVSFRENMNFAVYFDTKEISILDIEAKEKASIPSNNEIFQEFWFLTEEMIRLDKVVMWYDSTVTPYNEDGKYFKFKNNEKIYYYEEFSVGNYTAGFLFNEKGNLLAVGDRSGVFCVSISFSVNDSDFVIPNGYTEVDFEKLDFGF